jgi:hypothetical protein
MASVMPLGTRWKPTVLSFPAMRPDADECSQRNACGLRARHDHWRSRFARRDHIHVGGAAQSISHGSVFKRALDQRSSMHRIDR